ncbi:MAG: abortive infection family protein [Muribaculum sp.]|nr:abortive infection family protein [Muribaculum sp.]
MSFNVLNIREILDFLIGDYIIPDPSNNNDNEVDFWGSILTIRPAIQLPYMSGNQIYELYPRFNLEYPIYKDGTPSRWIMMKNVITKLDRIGRAGDLLCFLFSKPRFQSLVKNFQTTEDFEEYYRKVFKAGVEYINKQLYISQKKLISFNNKFVITDRDESISIQIQQIGHVSYEYVKTLPDRIKADVENKDYDSVINKCRTLIEEVLCYVIEQKGDRPIDNGKIESLQSQCKKLLKMNPDNSQDQRIIQMLSGLTTIINSIASLRNIGSDAHGVGSRRINIGEREAILICNATQTYCEYILSVFTHPNTR